MGDLLERAWVFDAVEIVDRWLCFRFLMKMNRRFNVTIPAEILDVIPNVRSNEIEMRVGKVNSKSLVQNPFLGH